MQLARCGLAIDFKVVNIQIAVDVAVMGAQTRSLAGVAIGQCHMADHIAVLAGFLRRYFVHLL